jgi:probable rRNA maturation factor
MPDDSDSRPPLSKAKTSGKPWLVLDLAKDAGDWSKVHDIEQLVHAAGGALAAHPSFKKHSTSEACVALSNDATVQKLNATYRGKDKPTNVLSFPFAGMPLQIKDGLRPLGDVVLALETVLRESHEQDVTPAHHVQHLVVHGLLHLLGFDHETSAEAEAMEALETEILASLGVADPYAEPLKRPTQLQPNENHEH